MRTILAAAICVLLSACVVTDRHTLAGMSASNVGCPADQIKISNIDDGFYKKSWVATCKSGVYACSGTPVGRDSVDIICSAMKR